MTNSKPHAPAPATLMTNGARGVKTSASATPASSAPIVSMTRSPTGRTVASPLGELGMGSASLLHVNLQRIQHRRRTGRRADRHRRRDEVLVDGEAMLCGRA